jgi:transcription initiation factor TFIIIB Brf1 subunit/transcription initiation factor TFIIB
MAPVNVLRLYKSKCIGRCQASVEQRIEAADAVFAEVAAHLEAQYRMPLHPDIRATARDLFITVYRGGALAARPAVCVLASVLHIACGMHGEPWLLSDFREAMGCAGAPRWVKIYKMVRKACGAPQCDDRLLREALVRRCCVGAGIDDPGIENAALEIYKRTRALKIGSGRHPGGGACACVYVATRLRPGAARSMLDISPYSGVSMDTAKKWYDEMWPHRAEIVPLCTEDGGWSTTSAEVASLDPRVR